MFEIFLNDIAFIDNVKLCNYADDSFLYARGKNLDHVKLNFPCKLSLLLKHFMKIVSK